MIGIEDAGGIALAGSDRPGMVEQLAEFIDRIADIGTKHVFTEELVEHLADRALQKGHATRVPRAVPGIGAVVGVMN